ncbi:MAG: hypothetical protein KBT21_05060 [Treponema sp.]|nr:hypothetical protein [Candidatus Treponema merdequi]
MNEIIEKLTAKDEMSAYEYCKQLVVESAQSAEYYKYKDSMSPLIKKDADELLKIIGV